MQTEPFTHPPRTRRFYSGMGIHLALSVQVQVRVSAQCIQIPGPAVPNCSQLFPPTHPIHQNINNGETIQCGSPAPVSASRVFVPQLLGHCGRNLGCYLAGRQEGCGSTHPKAARPWGGSNLSQIQDGRVFAEDDGYVAGVVVVGTSNQICVLKSVNLTMASWLSR
ncbi:hypothetical protein BJX76DRAFT_332674 [Aspergillus varians]